VCTDGWIGSSTQTMIAIGGWVKTNTPFTEIDLYLDGDSAHPIDFNGQIVTTQHQFFGVIAPTGFHSFEFHDRDGTNEDAKYIFADDFIFAFVPTPTVVNSSALKTTPAAIWNGWTVAITLASAVLGGIVWLQRKEGAIDENRNR
jgi:hypothetical protein